MIESTHSPNCFVYLRTGKLQFPIERLLVLMIAAQHLEEDEAPILTSVFANVDRPHPPCFSSVRRTTADGRYLPMTPHSAGEGE